MFATSAYTSNYPAADESETGITLAIAFEDFLKIRPARLRYTMFISFFRKEQLMSTSMCLNGMQTSLLNSVNSDLITTTIHIRFFYDDKAKLVQEFKDS